MVFSGYSIVMLLMNIESFCYDRGHKWSLGIGVRFGWSIVMHLYFCWSSISDTTCVWFDFNKALFAFQNK